jgi:NAD(P)-dependent dehydrogenase (short-subunit alcohol dehydrogenase family)
MLDSQGKVVSITGADSVKGATAADLLAKRRAQVFSADHANPVIEEEKISFDSNPVRTRLVVPKPHRIRQPFYLAK